uniref:Uncharacterized protein n=1 Tax=Knipowitschia caucasica TaxID=637954 RepID=A0AAV2LID1_KNICA
MVLTCERILREAPGHVLASASAEGLAPWRKDGCAIAEAPGETRRRPRERRDGGPGRDATEAPGETRRRPRERRDGGPGRDATEAPGVTRRRPRERRGGGPGRLTVEANPLPRD